MVKPKRKLVLSMGNDAKTVKGEKLGYLTGILYLAPAMQSGTQMCPMAAVAGCEKACLFKAGRGTFNSVEQARLAKTKRFVTDRAEFMLDVVYSIEAVIRKAQRLALIPLVRLNGTSDNRWESIPVVRNMGTKKAPNLVTFPHVFAAFPDVQFYDYTKLSNRRIQGIANYDLTFSYSGLPGYQPHVQKAIAQGMRMAVVFRYQRDIPETFMGLPVVPGDDSDVRHEEPQAHVVALYAKGPAVRDHSGFVVG